MLYAILNSDLLSVKEYRNIDSLDESKIKYINGEPLVRIVVYDPDPVFNPATQFLEEATPIIEPTQVRRYRVVSNLSQEEIDEIADTAAEDALFDTMKTYYSVFNNGAANNTQVQKAIAWLIKQEAKKRGAIVS